MPRIWDIPDDYPERAIGEYDRACSPDRFLFLEARRLVDLPSPTIRFNVKVDWLRKLDCLVHNGMVPLVGPRLSAALTNMCPEDVQLVPAVVHASDSDLVGYSLLNATREVAAIDFPNSSTVLIPGTTAIMSFRRVRFRTGSIDGINIARERDYHSYLLIGEYLAEELLRLRFTGLHFVRPEEVHS